MMRKIFVLYVGCFWAIVQMVYAQPNPTKLEQTPDGKYFALSYQERLDMEAEKNTQGKIIFYVGLYYLPEGTQVQVRNSCRDLTLPMLVKQGVGRGRYTEMDSLTDFVQNFSMSTMNSICFEIRCYVPIDSIMKVSEKQTNQEKLVSFKYLFSFMRKLGLQEAIEYGQKALELAKLTQNIEVEAELWLALGELKNQNVGRFFKFDSYDYAPPQNFDVMMKKIADGTYSRYKPKNYDEVIEKVAGKTGFSPADIKRWNDLWGYANEYILDHDFVIKLYDNPALLSDKELLEYLKIRIAQKDTNKIVWAYNALGNLYQIKHGYEEAEKYYLEMLKIRTQQKDKQKIYWVWGHLGYFYLKQGKYDLSIEYFTKLLEARKQERNAEQIIWALGGLRYTKLAQGLPEEALAYQKQIFELYAELKEDTKNIYGEKPIEYRYTVLSVAIGDYLKSFPDKSKAILDYLIKWRKGLPDSRENKVIASKIIEISTGSGELDSAIEVIKEIIKIETNTQAKIGYLNDVAFMYQKQGKYEQSKAYYQEAMKTAKKSAVPLFMAIQHKKMAYFYSVQDKDKEAKGEYKKLLSLMQKMKETEANNKEGYKDYRYEFNNFISDLVGVCVYLDKFPDTKEKAKSLAKEAVRLSSGSSSIFKMFLQE